MQDDGEESEGDEAEQTWGADSKDCLVGSFAVVQVEGFDGSGIELVEITAVRTDVAKEDENNEDTSAEFDGFTWGPASCSTVQEKCCTARLMEQKENNKLAQVLTYFKKLSGTGKTKKLPLQVQRFLKQTSLQGLLCLSKNVEMMTRI